MMKTWIVALLACAGAGLVSGAEPMTAWRTVGTVSAGHPVVLDFGPQGEGGYPGAVVRAVSGTDVKLRLSYATHPDGLGERGDFWHETRVTYLGADVPLPIPPASTDRYDVFTLSATGTVQAAKCQGLVRYVRVAVDTPGAWVDVDRVMLENRGVHSTEPVVGSFECSDAELTKLWQASVRTCRLAAIPGRGTATLPYLSDGAKRDRLVWSGDLWWAQRNMYAAFGPYSPYMPGSIDMLAENQTPAGYINACPYPESRGPVTSEVYGPFGSDEFAAWFVPVLADHYLYTGDRALLERRYPTAVKVLDYLAQYQDEDGLFHQRAETAKHSEGLAVGGTSLHHRTYMHLLLWRAYKDAARMATWLDKPDDAERFAAAADNLMFLLRDRFWRSDLDRFGLSLEQPDAPAFVANAAALAFGFLKGVEARNVLAQLSRDDHGKFQLMAMRGAFELNDGAKALALLNAHDWRAVVSDSWKGVHLTSECMHLTRSGWGDEAHPDTAIAGILTDYVLGVRPTSPGYATYDVDPVRIPGLTWAKGVVPTPGGLLSVEWHLDDGCLEVSVSENEQTFDNGTVATAMRPFDERPLGGGRKLVDFGHAAFGWLEVLGPTGSVEVVLGEKLAADGRIDRHPGGTIRTAAATVTCDGPGRWTRVPLKADKRNTAGVNGKAVAIRLPEAVGVVLPFRYAEVPAGVQVRRMDVAWPMAPKVRWRAEKVPGLTADQRKALDELYDFCTYSIFATSFAGVYVDGDRERIPYEGDIYINMLGQLYGVDGDPTLARKSIRHVLDYPTWPTEWKQHAIMCVWEDWNFTHDTTLAAECYDRLVREKLMLDRARPDGLLPSDPKADLVDWPVGERDGYDMNTPANAVVNAFHYWNLLQMCDLAQALGKGEADLDFMRRAEKVRARFNELFFDSASGLYTDGEGSKHASLHANAMAVYTGLADEAHVPKIADFLERKGMACSPYFAQYLVEALFKAGRRDAAIKLLCDRGPRSWLGMIDQGSTVTMEAWSLKAKPNQDWNHAWGAAPANLLPRYLPEGL